MRYTDSATKGDGSNMTQNKGLSNPTNPMQAWQAMPEAARVAILRRHFDWLDGFRLRQAAALPYGDLPDFVRVDVQLEVL